MKLCECGCGQSAPLAKQTDRKRGYVRGKPLRFIAGHNVAPKRDKVRVNCEWCNKEKEIYPSEIERFRFCSRQCQGHYTRFITTKEDGASYVDHWGYRHVKHNGEWIREHRLVIQQEIGRDLESDEHVHHLNGNKLDNRLSNLKLLTSQEHYRLHQDDLISKWKEAEMWKDLERDSKGRFIKKSKH